MAHADEHELKMLAVRKKGSLEFRHDIIKMILAWPGSHEMSITAVINTADALVSYIRGVDNELPDQS